jgi:hypothetical protein
LDAYGISCTFENVVALIVLCPSIFGLHLTFATEADKMQVIDFIDTNYGETIKLL